MAPGAAWAIQLADRERAGRAGPSEASGMGRDPGAYAGFVVKNFQAPPSSKKYALIGLVRPTPSCVRVTLSATVKYVIPA